MQLNRFRHLRAECVRKKPRTEIFVSVVEAVFEVVFAVTVKQVANVVEECGRDYGRRFAVLLRE